MGCCEREQSLGAHRVVVLVCKEALVTVEQGTRMRLLILGVLAEAPVAAPPPRSWEGHEWAWPCCAGGRTPAGAKEEGCAEQAAGRSLLGLVSVPLSLLWRLIAAFIARRENSHPVGQHFLLSSSPSHIFFLPPYSFISAFLNPFVCFSQHFQPCSKLPVEPSQLSPLPPANATSRDGGARLWCPASFSHSQAVGPLGSWLQTLFTLSSSLRGFLSCCRSWVAAGCYETWRLLCGSMHHTVPLQMWSREWRVTTMPLLCQQAHLRLGQSQLALTRIFWGLGIFFSASSQDLGQV